MWKLLNIRNAGPPTFKASIPVVNQSSATNNNNNSNNGAKSIVNSSNAQLPLVATPSVFSNLNSKKVTSFRLLNTTSSATATVVANETITLSKQNNIITTANNNNNKSYSTSSSSSSSIYSQIQSNTSPQLIQQQTLQLNQQIQQQQQQQSNNCKIDIVNNNNNYYSRFKNEFRIFNQIGQGGYGRVFKCLNILDEVEYAIKRLELVVGSKQAANVLKEVRIMAKLSHVNIIRYYNSWLESKSDDIINSASSSTESELDDLSGAVDTDYSSNQVISNYTNEDEVDWNTMSSTSCSSSSPSPFTTTESNSSLNSLDNSPSNNYSNIRELESNNISLANNPSQYLFIQMELCSGTLRSWMQSISKSNMANRLLEYKDIVKQILNGLSYIHSKGIVHRDITPDNIFIDFQPQSHSLNNKPIITIKIGDFGLSTTQESLKQNKGKKKTVGTILYSSPEQDREDGIYNEKTDIYSVGAIYYELLSNFNTTMERILSLSNLKKTLTLPTCFKLLYPLESLFIEKMIQHFSFRPSSLQLINDDYFFK